jgi:2-keto-3-deoxy-L-rhamnonate aldolase RhmA
MTRLQKLLKQNGPGPLFGAAAYYYSPAFVEICAYVGYKAMWIEMEHSHITFAQAADLCRISQGAGLLTMIRIPDFSRENVLKAAECGPDIIDLPMANTADTLREMVRYARFAPEGERGFFSVSRAVKYGLVSSVPAEQQKLNEELCLMAQIETTSAMDNLEEICAVPGVDIFMGPGDLAASLGVPGQTGHALVKEAAELAVRTAKQHGKAVAVGAAPADFNFWVALGVDLLFCTNDTACLKLGAQSILQRARDAVALAEEKAAEAALL